jgi:hypothetical protein
MNRSEGFGDLALFFCLSRADKLKKRPFNQLIACISESGGKDEF